MEILVELLSNASIIFREYYLAHKNKNIAMTENDLCDGELFGNYGNGFFPACVAALSTGKTTRHINISEDLVRQFFGFFGSLVGFTTRESYVTLLQ